MTLDEFSRRLRLLDPTQTRRPFVCDGSPLTCEAFIVGLNPTTGNFWPHWDDSCGFDKSAWFENYRSERRKQGHPREVSNTRLRLDKIIDHAAPIRCLTANVYVAHSRSGAELHASERNTEVFQFLLESIEPKALLLHGSDARKEVGRILKIDEFSTEQFLAVGINGRPVMVRAIRHLAYGCSYAAAEVLGRDLGNAVTAGF